MDITIQLDRENDQLYVLFQSRTELKGLAARTVKLTEEIFADFNAQGDLVGLDITNASKFLGTNNLDELSVSVAFSRAKKAGK